MGVVTDQNDILKCPVCGFDCTHIEAVHISARPKGEDGPIAEIRVQDNGRVFQVPYRGPAADPIGEGRRTRIALLGYCESGCTFALVFTQHKGSTFVQGVGTGAPFEGFPEINPIKELTAR